MAEKCYAKSSLIICTAYRIVLGCEMKEKREEWHVSRRVDTEIRMVFRK